MGNHEEYCSSIDYQKNEISGLNYGQARYYDQEQGRFISKDMHWNPDNMIYGEQQIFSEIPNPLQKFVPDPLAIGQSTNSYVYTMNNPLT
ncbi:hypothetical protein [Enterococcus sp. LJL51]|uniref:hypothetical protein n=1 Tax=Enterococcus sp. LJL51 TaxID=3416656 RepID=UPI003CF1EA14